MNKYTLAQIMEAWDAAYGEDMHAEYPGFFQRLQEENSEYLGYEPSKKMTNETIHNRD